MDMHKWRERKERLEYTRKQEKRRETKSRKERKKTVVSIATNDRGETSRVLGQIKEPRSRPKEGQSKLVDRDKVKEGRRQIQNIKAKSDATKAEEEGGGDSLGGLSYTS